MLRDLDRRLQFFKSPKLAFCVSPYGFEFLYHSFNFSLHTLCGALLGESQDSVIFSDMRAEGVFDTPSPDDGFVICRLAQRILGTPSVEGVGISSRPSPLFTPDT